MASVSADIDYASLELVCSLTWKSYALSLVCSSEKVLDRSNPPDE